MHFYLLFTNICGKYKSMQKKLKFIKEHYSLSTVPFRSPCNFCNLQCTDLSENLCYFCNKILNYVKENDILIYDLSNFFWYLAKEKDQLLLSWHELQEYQKIIKNKIEKIPCVFFHEERLAIYIDVGTIDYAHGCTKENIVHFLQEIFDLSCKFFVISKNVFQNTFCVQDIEEFMTGADKKKIKGINLTNKKLSPNVLNNSKLKEIICENLDFIK
jgi:hypothetical protein